MWGLSRQASVRMRSARQLSFFFLLLLLLQLSVIIFLKGAVGAPLRTAAGKSKAESDDLQASDVKRHTRAKRIRERLSPKPAFQMLADIVESGHAAQILCRLVPVNFISDAFSEVPKDFRLRVRQVGSQPLLRPDWIGRARNKYCSVGVFVVRISPVSCQDKGHYVCEAVNTSSNKAIAASSIRVRASRACTSSSEEENDFVAAENGAGGEQPDCSSAITEAAALLDIPDVLTNGDLLSGQPNVDFQPVKTGSESTVGADSSFGARTDLRGKEKWRPGSAGMKFRGKRGVRTGRSLVPSEDFSVASSQDRLTRVPPRRQHLTGKPAQDSLSQAAGSESSVVFGKAMATATRKNPHQLPRGLWQLTFYGVTALPNRIIETVFHLEKRARNQLGTARDSKPSKPEARAHPKQRQECSYSRRVRRANGLRKTNAFASLPMRDQSPESISKCDSPDVPRDSPDVPRGPKSQASEDSAEEDQLSALESEDEPDSTKTQEKPPKIPSAPFTRDGDLKVWTSQYWYPPHTLESKSDIGADLAFKGLHSSPHSDTASPAAFKDSSYPHVSSPESTMKILRPISLYNHRDGDPPFYSESRPGSLKTLSRLKASGEASKYGSRKSSGSESPSRSKASGEASNYGSRKFSGSESPSRSKASGASPKGGSRKLAGSDLESPSRSKASGKALELTLDVEGLPKSPRSDATFSSLNDNPTLYRSGISRSLSHTRQTASGRASPSPGSSNSPPLRSSSSTSGTPKRNAQRSPSSSPKSPPRTTSRKLPDSGLSPEVTNFGATPPKHGSRNLQSGSSATGCFTPFRLHLNSFRRTSSKRNQRLRSGGTSEYSP